MRNQKGFTMVELLAVIVILGIMFAITVPIVNRWVGKSKNESLESQKQTLAMATQSYAQANTSVLPKAIGESKIVTAQELRDANYLKEDLKNSEDKSCMNDSKVRIYKYDQTGYRYTAYIYCEGDEVPDEIEGIKPEIDITFTDSNGSNTKEASKNVSISAIQINLHGGTTEEGEKLGINGYQYIISVKYDDKDQEVEIFNSGSLNASGREELVIQKSIAQYVDITKVTYFLVTVEAYNSDGGYLKKTANSNYADTNPPICGTITGQAGKDEWKTAVNSTRKITVTCSDGDGSGCKQDSFTKTFNKEMDMGVITISDNAGNTTDCKVRVHLDWTTPTVTVEAYKATIKKEKEGNSIFASGTVKVANNQNPNLTISYDKYTNLHNNWMNKESYPYGVVYTISIKENILLDTEWKWETNVENLKTDTDSKYKEYKVKNTDGTSGKIGENQTTVTIPVAFTKEGKRSGKITVKDKAGNTTTITLQANIDYTNPSQPTINMYKWKDNSTAPSSTAGLTAYQNDSWSTLKVHTVASGSTDNLSKVTYYYTTTGATTNNTGKKGASRNIEANGTSNIKYYACDEAENCSSETTRKTIKVDHEAPTCTSSGGSTWTSKNITLKGTCKDNVSGCKNATVTKTFTSDPTNLTNQSPGTVEDNAGNKTNCPANQTVQIDKTPPIASDVAADNTRGTVAYITCKDNESGVEKAKVTANVSGTGTPTISLTCKNKAGLTTTKTKKVTYNSCKIGHNTCEYDSCCTGSRNACVGGYVATTVIDTKYYFEADRQGIAPRDFPMPGDNSYTCKAFCLGNDYECRKGNVWSGCCHGCTKKVTKYVWDGCASTANTCRANSCCRGENTCQSGYNY